MIAKLANHAAKLGLALLATKELAQMIATTTVSAMKRLENAVARLASRVKPVKSNCAQINAVTMVFVQTVCASASMAGVV